MVLCCLQTVAAVPGDLINRTNTKKSMEEITFDQRILEMDDDPEIMQYRYSDGNSVWLSVRFQLRMMNFRNISGSTADADTEKNVSNGELYKYIFHTIKNRPWISSSTVDILSIANYEDSREIPNWWTAFLREVPEFSRRELLYSHRCIGYSKIQNTYSLDYFYYKSLIKQKARSIIGQKNSTSIAQAFVGYLRNSLEAYLRPSDFAALGDLIHHVEKVCVEYRKQLYNYISKVKPKLLVCSEGNNGDWRYNILFSVANELKIPSVEVQHGALGLGMVFGTKLAQTDFFKQHKSTYLFTFGEYHNSMSNAAMENISFGHYRLELVKKNSAPVAKDNTEIIHIVLICEGIPASAINNGLVKTMEDGLRGLKRPFRLTVRLHPTEAPGEKYEDLLKYENARYSTYKTDDIYQLIQEADVVAGHISTVLFEALYFHKIPTIYKDAVSTTYIPQNLGAWYSNAKELTGLLEKFNGEEPNALAIRHQFWNEGTVRDNFLKFWQAKISK